MSLSRLLLLATLVAAVTSKRLYLNYTGDIMLGALFPVHRKGSNGAPCGEIQMEEGVQTLEAMLFTLKQINQDEDLLPGIKLGMIALDSCDNPVYGLEQSLDFVKGFIAHINEFHESEFQCADGSAPRYRDGGFDKVVSVIGGQSSSVTIQVANMLRLFRVPQVSYMSTSPSLSNKDRFPYFFRTVPSDINQAHAMLEILRQFNWTYVSVVYSDNEYGNHGFETLNSLATKYGVCFSTPQRVNKDRFSDAEYKQVLDNIVKKTDVNVVLVFAEKLTTLRLLEASRRHGYGSRFVWIGSDAWSTTIHREPYSRMSSSDDLAGQRRKDMSVLEGALAIQPLARTLGGFDNYFTSLTLDHREVNPWFGEYWEQYFRCKLPNDTTFSSTPYPDTLFEATERDDDNLTLSVEELESSCYNTSYSIASTKGYRQQRYLHFVRDAVYSVATALHNMMVIKCGERGGLCEEMTHIDGEDLRSYLSNVTFKDEGDKPFRFMDGRDGPPRYSILNFQRDPDGTYHWHIVGNYTLSEDGSPILNIDHAAMKYRQDRNDPSVEIKFPHSTCSEPCAPYQVKVRERDDRCCWKCRNCGEYQKRSDDFHCEDCPLGYRPTADHQQCVEIPEEFIDYHNTWAIAALAVASIGVFITVFVATIFWIYGDTPVIKASGRELSYLLLLGTLASFCLTFVIVARPTPFTCGLTRFFLGFCYTLCYAAIVTKTNRIARIFNSKPNTPHKTKYTSPQSQLVITALLTSVEVVINISWLIYVPPTTTHTYPTRDINLLICEGLNDYSYMVGLVYPFILIGFCTAYAIKTRKCPGGFNETRHIAFTNYTAIIIWLAFVPLYLTSTSNSIRIVTLAMSLSLSGLVQLGCLFSPKVYIVLFKPEKNTKEVVMAPHRSSSYVGTPPSAAPAVVVNGVGIHYVQNGGSMKSINNQNSECGTGHSPNLWRTKGSLNTFRNTSSKTLGPSEVSPSQNGGTQSVLVDTQLRTM